MRIIDVARYLIYLSYGENCYSLTPLKLQKILYYVQGWSYVWDGKPMFNEEFEAWQYGPVNREVYNQFKQYKRKEIPVSEGRRPLRSTSDELDTIQSVWVEYGPESAAELVSMTHAEKPWIDAYEAGTSISNQAIKEYFLSNY